MGGEIVRYRSQEVESAGRRTARLAAEVARDRTVEELAERDREPHAPPQAF